MNSWEQVAAFRLARHNLSERAPAAMVASVAADMGGAQAQVLSAAQTSIWARVEIAKIQDLDAAIWNKRTLVRAWCMRRTMFLLPSEELALFARGTARRADYNLRWALARVGSNQKLDKLLDATIEILKKPSTRNDLAQALNKSFGYMLKFKAGGGWGNKRAVPWVEVGGKLLPVGFLLHTIAARHVICSGPNMGNEATFVRADKWLPHFRDVSSKVAEEKLLRKYLRAYGPATVMDFALWLGLYVRDAKEIWASTNEKIVEVDVQGWKAGMLESDLSELEKAKLEKPNVHLLPNFDSFFLGHKSHRNIVDEINHKKVYRAQGWVSPVVLSDGRAVGIWSFVQRKNDLEVRVNTFSPKLSKLVSARILEEASAFGQFLGSPNVKMIFGGQT